MPVPDVIRNGRSDPLSTVAQRRDRTPVLLAIRDETGEIMIEGGMDHRVRLLGAGPQAVEIFEGAAMHVDACRRQRTRAGLGARQPQDPMPR